MPFGSLSRLSADSIVAGSSFAYFSIEVVVKERRAGTARRNGSLRGRCGGFSAQACARSRAGSPSPRLPGHRHPRASFHTSRRGGRRVRQPVLPSARTPLLVGEPPGLEPGTNGLKDRHEAESGREPRNSSIGGNEPAVRYATTRAASPTSTGAPASRAATSTSAPTRRRPNRRQC